jgi:hypothetical protein
MTRLNEPDHVEASELAIYATNDGQLYRQRAQPIIKNLALKMRRGTYNADLALKLWLYLADDAAKKYRAEFHMIGGFSKATRIAAAQQIQAHYDDELNNLATP